MRILAINFGHDASLALLENGKLTHYLEIERLSRIKHTLGILSSDIDQFLDACGVSMDSIDMAALATTQLWGAFHSDDIAVRFGYDKLHAPFIADLGNWKEEQMPPHLIHPIELYANHLTQRGVNGSSAMLERVGFDIAFPHGLPSSGAQADVIAAHNAKLVELTAQSQEHYRKIIDHFATPCVLSFKGRELPAFFVSHHYAHACYGHYYAASDASFILSHDGGLPAFAFNSGGVYYGNENRVVPLLSHKLALGYLYDEVSLRAGFSEGDGPGKLMGLASYGFAAGGTPQLTGEALTLAAYENPYHKPALDALIERVVQYASQDRNLRRQACEPFHFALPDNEHAIAMAATVQKLVEDAFTTGLSPYLSRMAALLPEARSLALVGGFALNCPANARLQSALGTLYVNALPGAIDSGLSIGAAVAVASVLGQSLQRDVTSRGNDAAFPPGLTYPLPDAPVGFETIDLDTSLPDFLAREIADGKICCLFRGRSEIGPRALGHRSIIAKASSAGIRDRINDHKGREDWRPLAPLCRREDFSRFFAGNADTCRFMLFTYAVTTDALPGITHCDGTARVQTIEKDDALLHALLSRLDALGEPPVIINTSFNTAGEPIVETPEHAFRSFGKLGFDYLVIDDRVFRPQAATLRKARSA